MFFKEKGEPVYAPIAGSIIPVGDVEEPIFSGRVVGDGIAIEPSDGEVVSPVAGKVSLIGEQKHTYGITTFDGIEILIHLGLNTVKLDGACFEPKVKVGDRVEVGTPLCTMDLQTIKQQGYDPTCPVIITSDAMDKIKRLTICTGKAERGKTVCMRFIKL